MQWIKTNDWSDELVHLLGIDKEKLPKIQSAYDIVGDLTAKAAEETGLSTKAVVITGGGDMLSMLYVSGMHKRELLLILRELVELYVPIRTHRSWIDGS